jgi:hypothetical protein
MLVIQTTDIAKMVSEAWKKLSPEERKIWEEKADRDKARVSYCSSDAVQHILGIHPQSSLNSHLLAISFQYEAEKAMYKGPWKIPSNKRKAKDPSAPKRPMSAFLAYSNSRRAALKRKHPKATNADLSRMLSKSWKELDPAERGGECLRFQTSRSKCCIPHFRLSNLSEIVLLCCLPVYMADEKKLRDKYKTDMSEWRKKIAKEKRTEREEREVAALKAADAPPQHPSADLDRHNTRTAQMENQWMGGGGHMPPQGEDPPQQEGQQQSDMVNPMFSNPYLQAAAFGGAGMGPQADALGLNPAAGNPYLGNPFANQGFMQGPGNPALSLFGKLTTIEFSM